MEEFVNVKDILVRDSRHAGYDFTLEELHRSVASIKLDIKAPEVLHSQINVAKNMAVYSYFLYSLAPEVALKSFRTIELALKLKYPSIKNASLRKLLKRSVNDGLLKDKNFSVCTTKDESTRYSESLIDIIPKLRNTLAHGSDMLHPACISFVVTASELINQLYQDTNTQ